MECNHCIKWYGESQHLEFLKVSLCIICATAIIRIKALKHHIVKHYMCTDIYARFGFKTVGCN